MDDKKDVALAINANNEQTMVDAEKPAISEEELKKLRCRDCYYGAYGCCSCGESKFVNRVIFPWTKGCVMFRRN